jgi:coenzyme F420-reducing hydrogenase beta subunit
MANITKSGINSCCSCGMCVVACAQTAITLKCNENGFYAPAVDMELCTDCGVCMKVCYQYLERKATFKNAFDDKPIYAAWSKNPDTVMTCTSGGVGYELMSYFYDKGYKICGVVFDAPSDNCKHIIAHTREDLEAIKTSKYLQSYTVDAFSQFKKGEKYLVIGTPCQIYGLRKWVQRKKWEDDFILIDFFCHGTPSYNLWKKWKEYACKTRGLANDWTKVNFRYKKENKAQWHSYIMQVEDLSEKTELFKGSSFINMFINGNCQNKSCYSCLLRQDNCLSDIRVADFWGQKYVERKDGVSLVILNTQKGKNAWNNVQDKFFIEECTFYDLLQSQQVRYYNENKRDIVLAELKDKNKSLKDIYNRHCRSPFHIRVLRLVKKILKETLKMQ